jgi:hypothetical protein
MFASRARLFTLAVALAALPTLAIPASGDEAPVQALKGTSLIGLDAGCATTCPHGSVHSAHIDEMIKLLTTILQMLLAR